MRTHFKSIAEEKTTCKICGASAELFGVADFHKHCNFAQRNVIKLSGIPIYYHKCTVCGFLFTAAMDEFTHQDFFDLIYNAQYVLVDPDFRDARPRSQAREFGRLFANDKTIRILDYGGGNGLTAKLLREQGFSHVQVYDPFTPEFATPPTEKFDLIICVEVLEHTPTPMKTFREIVSFLANPGLLFFTTLMRTPDVENQGMEWWYIGPRNGHVSIYSPAALAQLAKACGVTLVSGSPGSHVAFNQIPNFARHMFTMK